LGKLSVIHLALCDRKDELGDNFGPKLEDAVKMSALLQKAVDAAKHGTCISTKELDECKRQLTNYKKPLIWPDFLRKEPSESYESPSILG
jgi:hypothetical protein